MKCLMIGMEDNDISKRYMDITIPDAEIKLNCPVEILDAVRPDDPVIDHSKFSKIKAPTIGTKNKPWSGTEKAVWYSHVKAWESIMDGTEDAVWVLEHDVKVVIPPTTGYGITSWWGNAVGQARAYQMTPYLIERLYNAWLVENPIDMQIDTFMTKWFADHTHSRRLSMIFEIEHLQQFGTTIQHL